MKPHLRIHVVGAAASECDGKVTRFDNDCVRIAMWMQAKSFMPDRESKLTVQLSAVHEVLTGAC